VPAQNLWSASELISTVEGKAFTLFNIPEDVAAHPLVFVTITSTTCPSARVLVVYEDYELF